MKDMPGGCKRPQPYLVSGDGYEILKDLQEMLALMAHIVYNEDNAEDGHAKMTIGRADLHFIFGAIRTKLGQALERFDEGDGATGQGRTWH